VSARDDALGGKEDNACHRFSILKARNEALALHGAQRLLRKRRRALVADADLSTRLLISHHLRFEGFDIGECEDGRDALERLSASRFDLIVLDAGLSSLDGIALCRAIRQGSTNPHSAIVVVASSATEAQTVLALVNGADDCMTKPLSIMEFLAKVAAIMRRAEHGHDTRALPSVDRVEIRLDPSRRTVIARGRAVACSKQEFDVLYELAASPGIVFSRETLLARHWAPHAATDVRLVDPIISRLRRKIEREPDAPRMLLTVWGIGYKFAE